MSRAESASGLTASLEPLDKCLPLRGAAPRPMLPTVCPRHDFIRLRVLGERRVNQMGLPISRTVSFVHRCTRGRLRVAGTGALFRWLARRRTMRTHTQRRSDGTVTVKGVRYEVPAPSRHFTTLHLRVARWDLSSVVWSTPRAATACARSIRSTSSEMPAACAVPPIQTRWRFGVILAASTGMESASAVGESRRVHATPAVSHRRQFRQCATSASWSTASSVPRVKASAGPSTPLRSGRHFVM